MGFGLSGKQALILQLLMRGERYGLELVRESDGKLKRGTVYVLLSRLTDAGFVDSREVPAAEGQQGPPRRKYRITGLGQQVLAAWEGWNAIPA